MSDQPRMVPDWPANPFPNPGGISEGPAAWPVDPFDVRTTGPTEPLTRAEPAAPPPRQAGRGSSDLSFMARGGVVNIASVAASVLLNFALTLIVTRGFGTAVAGVFFEIVGLFQIISNAAELGADAGFLRFIPRYRALNRTQDVRRVLHVGIWPALVGGALIGWAMYAFAPQLGSLFFQTNGRADPLAVRFIKLLAPLVPLAGVSSVLMSASRGFGAMLPTAVIENAGKSLLRFLAALAVVVLGLKTFALGVGWAFPIVIGLWIVAVWTHRLLRRAERRDRYSRRDTRRYRDLASEFWRFSAPRGLVGALTTTQLWLDTLLVGGLLSTSEAAIYTVSTRFIAVSVLVIAALNIVIAPQISALMSMGEKRRAEGVYHTATEWIILSSYPPTFALATFAPLLLSFFGPQYVQGQTVLMGLSLGALFYLSTGPLVTVLVMGGKSGWSLFNQVASLGTNIVLNLILIPRMGINGAALAWALTGVVGQGTALIEVKLFLGLSPYHRRAFLAALGTGVIYGLGGLLTRLLFGASWPAFVGYLAVASGVYAAFLWRFRGMFRLGELKRALRDRGSERRGTLQPS
ncbi:MAG TPA: polysaccharide biosynthesis C-terminal domain-containing protein [Actinomycetota bacterium]|nr:polysaccharide biosynthesis C-terminal domain-containing protein [Actinomycetota bacterium]